MNAIETARETIENFVSFIPFGSLQSAIFIAHAVHFSRLHFPKNKIKGTIAIGKSELRMTIFPPSGWHVCSYRLTQQLWRKFFAAVPTQLQGRALF
ncbi:MAG: hypothetical protein ACREFE_20565, partial [Limisphaerales bacterium]